MRKKFFSQEDWKALFPEISDAENSDLEKILDEAEIWMSLNVWDQLKLLGLMDSRHSSLNNIGTLNHTKIALIQKSNAPSMIHQFRPINLCNTSYNIILKILASRLKKVL